MTQNLPASKYDRQERLSVWDQHIIENSTVLIAGIGGTGGEVAKNLALLGVGRLILVDNDIIEFSNLNRQLLFREEDIGQKKADIAYKRIHEQFNADIRIDSYPNTLQNIPQKLFYKTDIIAGCVDNYLARQYLNAISVEQNIPFIDSATDGFFGQIQYIKPKITSCLACEAPPPPNETRVLSAPCTLVGVPREREHCAWKALYEFNKVNGREPVETSKKDIKELTKLANNFASKNNFGSFVEKELLQLILFHVPSLITVNAVTSGIQSQEIVKALFLQKIDIMKESERKTLEKNLENHRFRIPSFSIYSALTGTLNTFDLIPDPDCFVCGQSSVIKSSIEVIEVNPKSLIRTIFAVFREKYQKTFVGFRGNSVLPEDGSIHEFLADGDRITLSSLEDEVEIRVQIKYQN